MKGGKGVSVQYCVFRRMDGGYEFMSKFMDHEWEVEASSNEEWLVLGRMERVAGRDASHGFRGLYRLDLEG